MSIFGDFGSNESVGNLFFLLLGSVLAFLSTFVLEYFKDKSEQQKKSKNIELVIRLELSTIDKTLEKLRTGLSYVNYYDFLILDRADKSVENLEKYRGEAIHLTNPILQEKFIDLLSDISSYLAAVRGIQRLYYDNLKKIDEDKAHKDIHEIEKEKNDELESFNQRKVDKSLEYVEIKRRLEELIRILEGK